jgi:hypothetical protein
VADRIAVPHRPITALGGAVPVELFRAGRVPVRYEPAGVGVVPIRAASFGEVATPIIVTLSQEAGVVPVVVTADFSKGLVPTRITP